MGKGETGKMLEPQRGKRGHWAREWVDRHEGSQETNPTDFRRQDSNTNTNNNKRSQDMIDYLG